MTPNVRAWIVIALAVVIGVARPFMPSHPVTWPGTYEAAAHLFVGGLCGAWLVKRETRYAVLVVVLSLVELIFFFKGGL